MSTSVCAFVGTPPCLYQPCSLRWRQGPFQLIEEPLTAGQVALIAALGPEYIGSLQAPPAPPSKFIQVIFGVQFNFQVQTSLYTHTTFSIIILFSLDYSNTYLLNPLRQVFTILDLGREKVLPRYMIITSYC